MISARDLDVQVGKKMLLSAVSLDVSAGEVLAVTGPSGSGKTTLLGCIAGTIVASHGELHVDGISLSTMDGAERARFRRERIGLIFQDPELLDELSVVENVAVSLVFAGVRRREAASRSVAILDQLGIGALADRAVSHLSGGEAQRVAVARALVKGAEIVIADEPTASLDAANAAAVTDLLIEHVHRARCALVIATHDPAVAQRCDRILSLRDPVAAP